MAAPLLCMVLSTTFSKHRNSFLTLRDAHRVVERGQKLVFAVGRSVQVLTSLSRTFLPLIRIWSLNAEKARSPFNVKKIVTSKMSLSQSN